MIETPFFKAVALLALLGGCAEMTGGMRGGPAGAPASDRPAPPEEIAAIVAAPPPPAAARTADQFDTVTDEQRQAARAGPSATEARLGETVASLGDPTESGLWMKTPLVDTQRPGRIEYPATGESAVVELRPLEATGGGSQVSLAAMRLLGAPLTDLPTLVVYAE
ncbi:hypothetical protein LX81_01377 [Palleronia aestuarii]|uniref:D-galactarate dehydratase n=1 Tax=Palleronia aestuarii TaxID=568105 RepID=A0A2W7P2I6_9RHOB|nr:hypothetical protein [Palleronia aestuarii]PZX17652.1 hypothetical protein LX81_01377 [Palleronia aestuarii]